jgi:predicted transcriptional regulator
MRCTLIQLDDDTYCKLRQLAFRQERSVSALAREMVVKGVEGGPSANATIAVANKPAHHQGGLGP